MAKSRSKSRIYTALSSVSKLKWGLTVKGMLAGVAAGLLVVFYRLGIEYGTQTAVKIYAYLRLRPLLILPWAAAALGAGLLVAKLVALEPMASGSGIPQVEGVVHFGLKMRCGAVLAVRFAGGIICSFFGLSLGREGPSIQIGAAGSEIVTKKFTKSSLERECLITGGAAAGLAAAFNAPLSGMMFALEDVQRSFSPLILVSATAASLVSDFVSKYFFGLRPVLDFAAIPQLPMRFYLWLLPLGLVSGLIGSLMNKSLLFFQNLYLRLPAPLRPCISLLIALPCGLFLPMTLGGGQGLIKLAESAGATASMLALYLVVKLVFTSTSFGSGVPGGIFMPILAVGTLSGSLLGLFAVQLGLPAKCISVFAVCAMAGALSASVKAPVTSILLTAEMSGTLVHLLPVAACSFIALLVSDLFRIDPIYEALLERFIDKNSGPLPVRGKGGLMECPVEPGSEAAGRTIGEIDWPDGLLVVALHRGAKEIVPGGSTLINAGDYLIAISPLDSEENARSRVRELCRSKE
jgi:H+/Cl- antiporter ClcA